MQVKRLPFFRHKPQMHSVFPFPSLIMLLGATTLEKMWTLRFSTTEERDSELILLSSRHPFTLSICFPWTLIPSLKVLPSGSRKCLRITVDVPESNREAQVQIIMSATAPGKIKSSEFFWFMWTVSTSYTNIFFFLSTSLWIQSECMLPGT